MKSLNSSLDLEIKRMEVRGIVRIASEVIAQYWPMRTFVYHNPLHGLEYLSFPEAIKQGKRFLNGNGYLPSHIYRAYLRSGRIQLRHLSASLTPLTRDARINLGARELSHGEVLRMCLTEGLCTPFDEPLDTQWNHDPHQPLVDLLADRLVSILPYPSFPEKVQAIVQENQDALGRWMTLSHWCDQVLGTKLTDQINGELIKWCASFLDEGHATWSMPSRGQGLYGAWKSLAAQEWSLCGIPDSRKKISQLPDNPEDALLESLDALAIPAKLRQDYLSLQLTALPGWAGFIKWRAEKREYAWQQAYPTDLVEYLAIRLWYARELVQKACQENLGIDGQYQAVTAYMRNHSHQYFLRRERVAGRLPATYAEAVDYLQYQKKNSWDGVLARYRLDVVVRQARVAQRGAARRLCLLALTLQINPADLLNSSLTDLKQLVDWMDAFPESEQDLVWLKAFEASYQDQLLGQFAQRRTNPPRLPTSENQSIARPHSQSVFCMDVRSEPFRRYLEFTGTNETYGIAGFFTTFIRYRAWGKEHDTEQFPVIMRGKNELREISRNNLGHVVSKHETRAKMVHAGHTLLQDLKENIVTPYVMVESLGWFYGLPIFGKTLLPLLYRRWTTWLHHLFIPSITTTLTVDKLTPADVADMLVATQRATVQTALQEQSNLRSSKITPDLVEALRLRALSGEGELEPMLLQAATNARISVKTITSFIHTLREHYEVNPRATARKKEQATRAGFTLEEQILTVDTTLRMMGLTRNFARLVLFCAHGSTSENNPYESALDCGACGGNEGKPNARALAMMANNPHVREQVAKNGIAIPSDTYFLAGQIDTTTDAIQLFDLEDVPRTHRADLPRLQNDLKTAASLTSQERCTRFPDVQHPLKGKQAESHVQQRSTEWSQVRPEWGQSRNTSFIIGRRELTKKLNLEGRVFLQSYDYREDPSNLLLEVLLTGPQVVAQWINMEHYFSTVDNTVYGSGSKIYHNVVGRIGIMFGPWSDLQMGLASQTVMSGSMPYHEPMRLLTIVEAPRERIEKLIARHEVLQYFYHNEWVHLLALEPEEGIFYRYQPVGTWNRIEH